MKKVIFRIVLGFLCFGFQKVQAQEEIDKLRISLGPDISLPLGTLKTTNSLGLVGTLQLAYPVSEKIRVVTSLGGGSFQAKSYDDGYYTSNYPTIGLLQYKLGAQFFVVDKLFFTAKLGISYVTQKGSSTFGFTYSPFIGYEFSKGGDVYIRYESIAAKTVADNKINSIGIGFNYHLF